MPQHKQSMILPYKPEEVFELVSDIESYPSFVKWITALRKSDVRQDGDKHACIGEAVVAFKGFTQSFSTRVVSDASAKRVDVSLVRGPLKYLDNAWRFEPVEDGKTKVHFSVDYDFSNFVLRALAAANHDIAIDRIISTFLAEAKRRYG